VISSQRTYRFRKARLILATPSRRPPSSDDLFISAYLHRLATTVGGEPIRSVRRSVLNIRKLESSSMACTWRLAIDQGRRSRREFRRSRLIDTRTCRRQPESGSWQSIAFIVQSRELNVSPETSWNRYQSDCGSTRVWHCCHRLMIRRDLYVFHRQPPPIRCALSMFRNSRERARRISESGTATCCGVARRAHAAVGQPAFCRWGDPSVNPADFRVTTFASGLNYPHGMMTLSDGCCS